jgi:hypothetical protein
MEYKVGRWPSMLMAFVPYAVAQNMTNNTANYKACTKYKQSVENISSPNGNFSGTIYDIAKIKAEYREILIS